VWRWRPEPARAVCTHAHSSQNGVGRGGEWQIAQYNIVAYCSLYRVSRAESFTDRTTGFQSAATIAHGEIYGGWTRNAQVWIARIGNSEFFRSRPHISIRTVFSRYALAKTSYSFKTRIPDVCTVQICTVRTNSRFLRALKFTACCFFL